MKEYTEYLFHLLLGLLVFYGTKVYMFLLLVFSSEGLIGGLDLTQNMTEGLNSISRHF